MKDMSQSLELARVLCKIIVVNMFVAHWLIEIKPAKIVEERTMEYRSLVSVKQLKNTHKVPFYMQSIHGTEIRRQVNMEMKYTKV